MPASPILKESLTCILVLRLLRYCTYAPSHWLSPSKLHAFSIKLQVRLQLQNIASTHSGKDLHKYRSSLQTIRTIVQEEGASAPFKVSGRLESLSNQTRVIAAELEVS